jgi:hypothetical protein
VISENYKVPALKQLWNIFFSMLISAISLSISIESYTKFKDKISLFKLENMAEGKERKTKELKNFVDS